MTHAVVPRQQGQLPRAGHTPSVGMSTCRIAGIALGVLVLGIVLSQIPDLIRYTRMTQM